MSTQDSKQISALLSHFNAMALGEGDVVAGANVIAALALTLANLAKQGTRVRNDEGTDIEVGMSFLATGLSSALINDRIVNPLRMRQNNILGHVRHQRDAVERSEVTQAKAGMSLFPSSYGKNETFNVRPVVECIQAEGPYNQSHATLCQLLEKPVMQIKSGIMENPILFASMSKPSDMELILSSCRDGRALVHWAPSTPADVAKYAEACHLLMVGCSLRPPGMGMASGHLMILDPNRVTTTSQSNVTGDSAWLLNMLHLSDHHEDGGLSQMGGSMCGSEGLRIISSFEKALCETLVTRLDESVLTRSAMGQPYPSIQHDWIKFLMGLEARMPGICATLRALPASLLFGMVHLDPDLNGNLPLFGKSVLAFSRHLATRMIVSCERMQADGHRLKVERNARKVQGRLTHYPLKPRVIYRSIGLRADECREAFDLLAARGVARMDEDQTWVLSSDQATCPPDRAVMTDDHARQAPYFPNAL